jgi:hypothetical protein
VTTLSFKIELGTGTYYVRHVRSPSRDRFLILSEYAEDERLGPSVIGSIERVLGVKTGFPCRPQRDPPGGEA